MLRSNPTDAEKRLWSLLRRKQVCGLQFYRQRPIGNFIVDFYCPDIALVIEVDGGQHYSESGQIRDQERDRFPAGQGLSTLRFTNLDVLRNPEGVMHMIDDTCRKKSIRVRESG